MSIISIAGVTRAQGAYEFPDYQEKIEQIQSQIENLQSRMTKEQDGSEEPKVKQQRVEMIQSQIVQLQTQIQRLETMDGNRNARELSAEVLEANEFLSEPLKERSDLSKSVEDVVRENIGDGSEVRLDILV